MPTMKPYGGTSRDRLVEMINKDNSENFVYGTDFTFGSFSAASGTGGRNTKIRVIPTDSEKYGQQDIEYYRLPLAVLNYLPEGYIKPVKIDALPFTIHSVLDRINESLGLDLTPEEVLNQEFRIPQDKYTLKIATNNSSMAWTFSSYDFKIEGDFLDYRFTTTNQVRLTTDGTPRRIAV